MDVDCRGIDYACGFNLVRLDSMVGLRGVAVGDACAIFFVKKVKRVDNYLILVKFK